MQERERSLPIRYLFFFGHGRSLTGLGFRVNLVNLALPLFEEFYHHFGSSPL